MRLVSRGNSYDIFNYNGQIGTAPNIGSVALEDIEGNRLKYGDLEPGQSVHVITGTGRITVSNNGKEVLVIFVVMDDEIAAMAA